jgi:hypothetical protein
MDRANVIKAIDICYTPGHNCTECPLFQVEDCNDKLMRDALALLKEQEALKPKKVNMKIVKRGVTVRFDCESCGCLFRAGIHIVYTPDNGENYYAECPICGSECHADVNARDSDK